MATVSPFHTSTDEEPAVYHDQSECPDGRRILPENKVWGTDGRRRCDECDKLL